MAIKTFKDYPNTETPLSAENLNEMQQAIMGLIWPIGRGFIDFTNTDYSNYLGFTWVRELIGMVPVGKDETQTEFDTIGKTGGAKTHTLNVNELPSHQHGITVIGTGSGPYGYNISSLSIGTTQKEKTSATGGGQAHNNLQPYKVVNYWKRVA